ncbi:hypothetical protein CMI37_06500 [Candidatus Pacearchaeota archaeon]|nr:hypothetical protein [Candidatus Pacearchaeota archaeon]
MATVNLAWTVPSSITDVDTIEIWRWAGLSATATADLNTLITAGATNPLATIADTETTHSDTSAPVGVLTYAAVSRNTTGHKLESSGHANITTT